MGSDFWRTSGNNRALSEKEEVMARFGTCKRERGGGGESSLSVKK